MIVRYLQRLVVVIFSLGSIFFSQELRAQEEGATDKEHSSEKKEGFNAGEVIFDHVLDAHEFHFFDYTRSDGSKHPVTIPLPVILYSPQRGLDIFSSSRFDHGHTVHNGYKLDHGKVLPVSADGKLVNTVKVYDLSLTRNVVQMLLALTVFIFLMLRIASKYSAGVGRTKAPSGFQNAIESVIIFIRDDVAIPNLGHKHARYLPYLLTVFFFILINNIFGLIPGSANVTGNIAFTAVLGVISFFVILFSSNSHFWSHIFNPPGVPGFVKPILILVEFLGVFIKPFALIIRLFANMVAGHIIIISLISLIFIFGQINPAIGWATSPFSIAFTVFIYFIEILVAFLQAYIFTTLTAVFIGLAMEEPHPKNAHHNPNLTTAKYDDPVII
ncbi:MAG TPA: F0F1 ATP synthase subunit A [Flavitalea sp.]|nr:F0F1 ATP synthase subunit A [Flavitalea sp.]